MDRSALRRMIAGTAARSRRRTIAPRRSRLVAAVAWYCRGRAHCSKWICAAPAIFRALVASLANHSSARPSQRSQPLPGASRLRAAHQMHPSQVVGLFAKHTDIGSAQGGCCSLTAAASATGRRHFRGARCMPARRRPMAMQRAGRSESGCWLRPAAPPAPPSARQAAAATTE